MRLYVKNFSLLYKIVRTSYSNIYYLLRFTLFYPTVNVYLIKIIELSVAKRLPTLEEMNQAVEQFQSNLKQIEIAETFIVSQRDISRLWKRRKT